MPIGTYLTEKEKGDIKAFTKASASLRKSQKRLIAAQMEILSFYNVQTLWSDKTG